MQLDMFSGGGVSANREVAPVVEVSKLSPQFNVEEEKHFYYVSGVLGMKNDGTFTDEKRHWMTFTRETAIPMQEGNEKPREATQRGVFVGTEFGTRLKIAKPVTPQVPGGDMEKYIKVAADSIEQLRKVDVYRVLVESNRVEFRQAIASYIKSKRPDLIEEVDEVLMEAGVGAAGSGVEVKAAAKAVGLDEVRTEYPFGKASREDQFFGSKVQVLSTGMTGDVDWVGTIQSTMNGGRLFSVKRDGADFSVRIGGDRIEVLERVENGVEQNVVGAAKDVAVLPDSGFENPVKKSQQSERKAFEHAGYQIYPSIRSDGREVWLLQSQDNKVAGKVGFGDEIYDSVELAQKNAEFQLRNAQWKAEVAAKVDAEEALAEAARESNRGLSIAERKANAVLEKGVSFGGKNMTLRGVVEQLMSSGAEVSSDEVDAIKPMSRMQFHRADQRQQDAHEKRVKEAGKKTLYYVGDYNLGKTAYDYACSLKEKDVPVAEVSNSSSDPITESIKRNNAREQQFNRDAQYQQLMFAKREDVQGIVDGMSVEDTQAALDRLNAALGDNLPVRASLAVKLDRADKVAAECLNLVVEVKEPWQMTREEYFNDPVKVRRDAVGAETQGFAIKYEYENPHPAGPFKGSYIARSPQEKGSVIGAVFGRAIVISSSKTKNGTDNGIDLYEEGKAYHRRSVVDAIEEGKPIPVEVLGDYPDLKPGQETKGEQVRMVVELEGNWSVSDIKEIEEEKPLKEFELGVSDSYDQSYAAAEEIAGDRDGWLLAHGNEARIYAGRVLGVTEQHVVQSLGKTAVIHQKANLDRVPETDEVLNINYDGAGRGAVEPRVETLDKGLSR